MAEQRHIAKTIPRVQRAIDQIDKVQQELGDVWEEYEFDALSSARAALREWLAVQERIEAQRG